jgi:hypothetical protein
VTKLLEQGIEAVRQLPADRQDMAGELLLALAVRTAKFCLTSEQLEDLKMSMEEADRREFAAEAEIAATWEKFGL